jgi:hypothetical protein
MRLVDVKNLTKRDAIVAQAVILAIELKHLVKMSTFDRQREAR